MNAFGGRKPDFRVPHAQQARLADSFDEQDLIAPPSMRRA
jgi:hypothetical protein